MGSDTYHWTVADWMTQTMNQIEARNPETQADEIARLEGEFFAYADGDKLPALWQTEAPPRHDPERLRQFMAKALVRSARESA